MTRRIIDTNQKLTDEAQFVQEQAPREQPTLDPRSVLLTAQGYIEAGETERARQLVAEYRRSLKGE